MLKILFLILATILLSCSGEDSKMQGQKTDTDGCEKTCG